LASDSSDTNWPVEASLGAGALTVPLAQVWAIDARSRSSMSAASTAAHSSGSHLAWACPTSQNACCASARNVSRLNAGSRSMIEPTVVRTTSRSGIGRGRYWSIAFDVTEVPFVRRIRFSTSPHPRDLEHRAISSRLRRRGYGCRPARCNGDTRASYQTGASSAGSRPHGGAGHRGTAVDGKYGKYDNNRGHRHDHSAHHDHQYN